MNYIKKSETSTGSQNEGFFDNQIMNVKEVASFLRVSQKTVYDKTRDGVLPHQKIGGRIVFLRSELVRFLKGE